MKKTYYPTIEDAKEAYRRRCLPNDVVASQTIIEWVEVDLGDHYNLPIGWQVMLMHVLEYHGGKGN